MIEKKIQYQFQDSINKRFDEKHFYLFLYLLIGVFRVL